MPKKPVLLRVSQQNSVSLLNDLIQHKTPFLVEKAQVLSNFRNEV